MKTETITIREAIELFPKLLDEPVKFGFKSGNESMRDADSITFQFVGDGNYRTRTLNKMIKIHNKDTGNEFEVFPRAALYDMRRNCPQFFRTPHGKRETYTEYRGQLIVRNTVQFTGCKPERKTTLYLYLPNGYPDSKSPDFFCVGCARDIASAKRMIDRLLETKEYSYDEYH